VTALVQRRLVHAHGARSGAAAVVAVAHAGEDAPAVDVDQVLGEPVAQRGGDRDFAPTVLGLRRHLAHAVVPAALHADHAGGEVDVVAVQRHQLAAAQPGVQRGRPQRPILRVVEPVEHRLDLRGGGEPRLPSIDRRN
jgi:hypothetical protein